MSEAAAKKEIQKLQRAIVDGLEDVKGHDIRVFNTEHLSPLFERVIIASGTSNRQTQALATSVRDKVRDAGFAKPRLEGEENGEWIIVDCGAAVAHVMQPAIRQYYNLEEIWGDKPVRMRLGAAVTREPPSRQAASAKPAGGKTAGGKAAARKTVAGKKTAAKAAAAPASAAKAGARPAAVKTPGSARVAARRPAARKAPVVKVVVVGRPAAAKSAQRARAAAPARKRTPTRGAR